MCFALYCLHDEPYKADMPRIALVISSAVFFVLEGSFDFMSLFGMVRISKVWQLTSEVIIFFLSKYISESIILFVHKYDKVQINIILFQYALW